MRLKSLSDSSLLPRLENYRINADDQLKNGLPKTERVFDLLPLVIEYSWRGEAETRQPDPVIGNVIEKRTTQRENLEQAQYPIHFLVVDHVFDFADFIEPEEQAEDLAAVGDIVLKFFGPVDAGLFALFDEVEDFFVVTGSHAGYVKSGRVLDELSTFISAFARIK